MNDRYTNARINTGENVVFSLPIIDVQSRLTFALKISGLIVATNLIETAFFLRRRSV